ncbi:MAG: hypothetical protein AAGH79_08135 [Bacteroidota bacterium]
MLRLSQYLLFPCFLILPFTAFTQAFVWADSIAPSDGFINYLFGYELDLSKEWLAVGMPRDNDPVYGSGSVYLYQLDGGQWNFFQKIAKPDPEPLDRFGSSVAIYGDYVLVGAQKDDIDGKQDQGAVHLYQLLPDSAGNEKKFQLIQSFTAFDGDAKDRFGRRVDLSADFIFVGARGDDDNGQQSGSVYVYKKEKSEESPFVFWQKIVPDDGDSFDRFGDFLRVFKNNLIVGASGDDDAVEEDSVIINCGSSYVYQISPGDSSVWTLQKKILPQTTSPAEEEFGHGVDIFGRYAIAGAMTDSIGVDSSGSAYIFNYKLGGTGNWGQAQKLVPQEPIPGSLFGFNVAMGKRLAVVGSRAIPEKNIPGYAYIYQLFPAENEMGEVWVPIQQIAMPGAAFQGKYGNSIAIYNRWLALGQRADTINDQIWHGSVQMYYLDLQANASFSPIPQVAIDTPLYTALQISPNPFNGSGLIELATSLDQVNWKRASLQVVDLNGKIWWQKDLSEYIPSLEVQLDFLPPGSYVLVQSTEASLHTHLFIRR